MGNITFYLFIVFGTDGSDSVFIAIFIIGRLCVGRPLGTLDFRAISSRVCRNGALARAVLGLAAIQLFDIPVGSIVYISRPT